MLDLSCLDLAAHAERGATLHLRHPVSNEPLTGAGGEPVTITLVGAESRKYTAGKWRMSDENRNAALYGQYITAETLDRQATAILADCTLGWSGITVDGSAWDCNPEAAAVLYGRFQWIKAQVDAFCTDIRNFPPPAAEAA